MKRLLLVALLCCSAAAYGQGGATTGTTVAKRFIEVTGTASKAVTPDKIFLAITLKNQVSNRQQLTIQQQEDALRQLLLKSKIDLGLLTLADASADIILSKKKAADYELTKEFLLQLATAEQVTKLAQEMQAMHIGELAIARTEYSKIESLQKEVRIAAIKAARDKAEYLLQAIGEQVDKPLEIQEIRDSYFTRSPLSNTLLSNVTGAASEEDGSQTTFSKIQVKFSYSAKFGIK